jgi:dihydrofolate reductase
VLVLRSWRSVSGSRPCRSNDLIDEYRLFIFPVVLGSGKRLFGSGTMPVALKQVESVTSGKGGTYHRLERAGNPEYGQIGS